MVFLEQKSGQGAEKEQRPQAAQGQHHPEQPVHPEDPPGEQHGIGHPQQQYPRQKHDHRGPDAFELEGLVGVLGLEQVNELAPGDRQGVEDHHQQKDAPEVEQGLAHRSRGEHKVELLQVDGKDTGGKHGDELGEEHPQQQPHPQGEHPDAQGLQKEQQGHPAAVHP